MSMISTLLFEPAANRGIDMGFRVAIADEEALALVVADWAVTSLTRFGAR